MNNGRIANNNGHEWRFNNLRPGGGVYIENGSFTMYDGRIANNKGSIGGGVYIGNNGTFIMKNGRIENNQADSIGFGGGGVYISDGESFYMHGGVIASNRARGEGGGVCVSFNSYYGPTLFSMTGGIIYGSNGGSNANTASKGNAVYDVTKSFLFWSHNRTINRY
jgi:hypothetical protein